MIAASAERRRGAAQSAALCPRMSPVPSFPHLFSGDFLGVSIPQKSANGCQMRRGPRGKSSLTAATGWGGGGAARSAAMSAVVVRGLHGTSAAFFLFRWTLIIPKTLDDASQNFAPDLCAVPSHPSCALYPSGELDEGMSLPSLPCASCPLTISLAHRPFSTTFELESLTFTRRLPSLGPFSSVLTPSFVFPSPIHL